jgi:uncharacterized protein YggE
MKKIISVLILCFIFTSVLANPVPEFPFVILTERLEKRVEPDVVKISFSLTAYDEKSEISLERLREAGQKVIALLNKHGIPLKLLESTQIDKEARRARKDGIYNLEILGYETRQGFNLTLSELKKYPGLMNELISIDGVTGIDALFKTTNEEKYKAEMIEELSAKARKKADALAKAQSRSVKRVYGITTEGNFGEAYAIFSLQYEPRIEADVGSLSRYGMDLTMMVPEYIVVSQRITAIYELK